MLSFTTVQYLLAQSFRKCCVSPKETERYTYVYNPENSLRDIRSGRLAHELVDEHIPMNVYSTTVNRTEYSEISNKL